MIVLRLVGGWLLCCSVAMAAGPKGGIGARASDGSAAALRVAAVMLTLGTALFLASFV